MAALQTTLTMQNLTNKVAVLFYSVVDEKHDTYIKDGGPL